MLQKCLLIASIAICLTLLLAIPSASAAPLAHEPTPAPGGVCPPEHHESGGHCCPTGTDWNGSACVVPCSLSCSANAAYVPATSACPAARNGQWVGSTYKTANELVTDPQMAIKATSWELYPNYPVVYGQDSSKEGVDVGFTINIPAIKQCRQVENRSACRCDTQQKVYTRNLGELNWQLTLHPKSVEWLKSPTDMAAYGNPNPHLVYPDVWWKVPLSVNSQAGGQKYPTQLYAYVPVGRDPDEDYLTAPVDLLWVNRKGSNKYPWLYSVPVGIHGQTQSGYASAEMDRQNNLILQADGLTINEPGVWVVDGYFYLPEQTFPNGEKLSASGKLLLGDALVAGGFGNCRVDPGREDYKTACFPVYVLISGLTDRWP